MPRPREFDEGVALEAAMQRFWAGGFAATSVRDIGNAMGLGQASVYNAFGDKRTLFTQCLDRYLDANMRARIARVEKSLPPRQAIETFLTEIVERSLESRLGCLLANAALETIASRRCASGGPTTNGWVSKAGHGAAATASRVGCGVSSSRAMVVPPCRHLSGHWHLPSVGMFYSVRFNTTQAGWIAIAQTT